VATVAATKPLSKLLPDPTFRDLVEQLLTYDPAKRITAKQALQHPFFDQIRHEFEPVRQQQQQSEHPSQPRQGAPSSHHYAAAASSASSSSSSVSHHRDWERDRDRDRDRERERERPRQQQAGDSRFALFDAQQERAAFIQAEAAAVARSRQQYRMSPPRNAHSRHDDQRNDDRRDYRDGGSRRLTPPRSSFGGAPPLPPRSAQHHDDGYSDRRYSYHEEKAHRR